MLCNSCFTYSLGNSDKNLYTFSIDAVVFLIIFYPWLVEFVDTEPTGTEETECILVRILWTASDISPVCSEARRGICGLS